MKGLLGYLLGGMILSAAAEESHELIQSKLTQVIPGLEIATIETSPIRGLYSVVLKDGTVLQASVDGRYFVYGDLYEIQGDELVNQTQAFRKNMRKQILNNLDESAMIVFSPPANEVKAILNVFTDVDCGFCRMFHQEVPELNNLGVAVRYLAFPRSGIAEPFTDSYRKMVSAWCADDPLGAMSDAKDDKTIVEKTCTNPVAEQYRLGEQLGITGTPAIIFDDGRLMVGYKTAAQFANLLKLDQLSENQQ